MVGLGDVVNDSSNTTQWAIARSGYDRFRTGSIPVLVGSGNHDWDSDGAWGNVSNYTRWNAQFTAAWYTNSAWWTATRGGFYTNTQQQNAYILVTNSVDRFCLITLQCGPSTNELLWASNVASTYPDYRVILATHAYLRDDGMLGGASDPYPISGGSSGETIWSFMRSVPNLTAIIGGHYGGGIISPGLELHIFAVGDNGNVVSQVFCNYQDTYTPSYPSADSELKVLSFRRDGSVVARTWDAGTYAWRDWQTNQYVLPGQGASRRWTQFIEDIAPTAAEIGGSVGAKTNCVLRNVNGALFKFWSDGTTVWSEEIGTH